MRVVVVLVAVVLTACDQTSSVTPSPSKRPGSADCRPTLAQMVPPQTVMDVTFGGMSPQPSATPSRDAWAASSNWIGNDALWISLPTDGVYERKFSKLFAMAFRSGPITITGRRLEDGGPPTRIGSMSSENIGSTITFPQAGCWDVTYELAGEPLRFTLKVVDT